MASTVARRPSRTAMAAYTGNGTGVGGTAVAGVVITNNTGGTISSSNATGIESYSLAKATAKGHKAYWRDGERHHDDHQLCGDHQPK